MRKKYLGLFLLILGCAHQPLSYSDRASIRRPAYVGRVEAGAGPKVTVFQEDGSYNERLKQLTQEEGDKRLTAKMREAVSGYEVAEELRAEVALRLKTVTPWTMAVEQAKVASALDLLLVNDTTRSQLDYARLKSLDVDAVLEFVIEEYGMHSRDGKASIFVAGRARVFRPGGATLWNTRFRVDQFEADEGSIDPFLAAKDPSIIQRALRKVSGQIADSISAELGSTN